MPFDFDRVIERRGTASVKWDTGPAADRARDVVPAWVADMDFAAPPEVLDAIRTRLDHGVLGYSIRSRSYDEAIEGWMSRRFGWTIGPDWIVTVPGVVPAVYLAVQAFTEPGDRVVIQSPVYHPFPRAVEANDRLVVRNRLVEDDLHYSMDLDDLERAFAGGARMLILCSPHNPVGRVWRRNELEALAALCVRHQVVVLSDEIHQDIVFPGHPHVPLASLGPEIAALTVTATAPNKTFNIAGLQAGNVLISHPARRKRYRTVMSRAGLHVTNLMALIACEAAYTHGERWLAALVEYLGGNAGLVGEVLDTPASRIGVTPLEGTYLMWLDLRRAGQDDDALRQRLLEAGVWLDEGTKFGPGGEQFQRLNIGCPRATLSLALERIVRALEAQ